MEVGTYSILVPHSDAAVFKSIARRLGWKVQKMGKKRKTPYEQSLDDVACGRITKYASVDEVFKSLGGK